MSWGWETTLEDSLLPRRGEEEKEEEGSLAALRVSN